MKITRDEIALFAFIAFACYMMGVIMNGGFNVSAWPEDARQITGEAIVWVYAFTWVVRFFIWLHSDDPEL